jgi:peptidoglycan hydrolase-like protein with peptidoglycan-binding domain
MANTAADVMSIAKGEIGYSRWNDPQNGTKYGRWYAEYTGEPYYGTNGVPYCAMFVSWCFNQAGAKAAGIPGAYCPWIVTAGKKAGKTVSKRNAKYGDIVLFDWEGDGTSDHVGLVESNNGSYLTCVEGNTNNGQVMRRTRAYSTVICVIRPDYGEEVSAPAPAKPSTPVSKPAPAPTYSPNLDVDGLWGRDTTTALQTILGTGVDGIVSQQYAIYRKSNPGLLSSSWEWVVYPRGGSAMVKAMQRKIGASADGFVGPETISALQSYLGTPVDGRIDKPSTCVRALQERLNTGTF